jgi:hypothetical protein
MKKIILVLLVGLPILVVGTLVSIPLFFKGDILRLIERQSSRYIRGQLTIGDVSISMFRSFPDLNVSLTGITLAGTDANTADTLLLLPRFEASVNLRSLLSGKEIIINRLLLRDARLDLHVSADDRANWDILPATTDAAPSPDEGTGGADPAIRLDHLAVERLSINYRDDAGGLQAAVGDLSLDLRGNFSERETLLAIDLALRGVSLQAGGTTWLNNINIAWKADAWANLHDLALDLRGSTLSVNDLTLEPTGSIAVAPDRYTLDLALAAPDTRFESLLALLPASLRAPLDGIKTTGEFNFRATARGEYRDGHLPAIDLHLGITDASLKYPDLPGAIESINLALRVTNPGGPVANTRLDLERLAFRVADNPFEIKMQVENPDDPRFSGTARGTIHFESIKRALPLDHVTINGTLTADLAVDGKYAYIKQEQYDKITATGHLSLAGILFKSDNCPTGIAIPTGEMTVTPARLELARLQAKIGASDFNLAGNLSNYIPYFLEGKPLAGDFSLTSSLLDVNELMGGTPADTTTAAPAAAATVIEVPANLRLTLRARVNTLRFDEMTVKNIDGTVRVRDGVAHLDGVGLELLDGKITLRGAYDATAPARPTVDFDARASDIDLRAAHETFSFIRESLPIALDCSGKVSLNTTLSATLDREMKPLTRTMNGKGTLSAANILLSDNPTLSALSALFKNEELGRLSLSALKIDFAIRDGAITVEPFTTKLAGLPMTMHGKQSADGDLDYTISVNVPRARFGRDIEKLLAPLPGASTITDVDLDVKVTGTLDKPHLSPDFSRVLKAIEKAATNQVKKDLQKEIEKGLDKLFKRK